VHDGLVDDALADRGRGGLAPLRVLPPVDLPRLGVEREEEALLLRQVQPAVADRGRELERVVGVDRPQPAVGRPVVVGGDVPPGVVVAVRRPRPRVLLLGRRLRLLRLGGHELLGRGAALLDRLVLLVVDVRAGRDHDDKGERATEDQAASSGHRGQAS
jgi:hypothetical protein